MTSPFGHTRNVVKERYALLTPNGHVAAPLPGWVKAACVVLISPGMGARFCQTLITFQEGGSGVGDTGRTELFAYVLDGGCSLHAGKAHTLTAGSYTYLPPGSPFKFSRPAPNTRLLLFQKTFEPLAKMPKPPVIVSHAAEKSAVPFLGDTDARLQTLLPDSPAFDMAVNIFTYQPGATLPFVETHIMEHGLLMLSGQGVYRLDADWHPVMAGDVIWMAPYCPQWFVAMGKSPASYIYYKDVNRLAMVEPKS